MRILSQDGREFVILENQKGICVISGGQEGEYCEISADNAELGKYSSVKKGKDVLMQIFKHEGETFIMPQDDEVGDET